MSLDKISLDIKLDLTAFNESLAKTTKAFEAFGQAFRRSQHEEILSKKARKANSRRLRYSLKAHSR